MMNLTNEQFEKLKTAFSLIKEIEEEIAQTDKEKNVILTNATLSLEKLLSGSDINKKTLHSNKEKF